MIRKIVERLGRGRTFKRRLPSDFNGAALVVSPDAQLKYLKRGESAFDDVVLRLAREEIGENERVWDVGANVGVLATAAAAKSPTNFSLAIEADIWLAGLIRRTAKLRENAGLSMDVLPVAVSDRCGTATFLIAERGRASNALESVGVARTQMGGAREKITVPTLTLDVILEDFEPPTFVKIDVEGAEDQALRGAEKLLREVRPTLAMEVGGKPAPEVNRILKEADYVFFNGDNPKEGRQPVEECPFNTVAVPREKL
ncbi:MAG: FkbM family methyltransferase [Ignavibacteriales bacterium]|nr:FkbM family methyltransferase [Ignavibacteriales bacterium]